MSLFTTSLNAVRDHVSVATSAGTVQAVASQSTTVLSQKSFTTAEGKDAAPQWETLISKYPNSPQKAAMETLLEQMATSGLSEADTARLQHLNVIAPKPEEIK